MLLSKTAEHDHSSPRSSKTTFALPSTPSMMSRMGRASLMAVPSARVAVSLVSSRLMRFAKAAFKAATGLPSHFSVKSISFDVTSAPRR